MAERSCITGSPYHNYRGNQIIDNGLKSIIFVKDDRLRIHEGALGFRPLKVNAAIPAIAAAGEHTILSLLVIVDPGPAPLSTAADR
jgi:hypothetical protein